MLGLCRVCTSCASLTRVWIDPWTCISWLCALFCGQSRQLSRQSCLPEWLYPGTFRSFSISRSGLSSTTGLILHSFCVLQIKVFHWDHFLLFLLIYKRLMACRKSRGIIITKIEGRPLMAGEPNCLNLSSGESQHCDRRHNAPCQNSRDQT